MRVATIESPMELKCGRIYWEVLQFNTRRNLRRWAKRHHLTSGPKADGITVSWKHSKNLVATVLLCDDVEGVEIIAHEAVHMAKAYLRRFGSLRDEEALAYLTGNLTTSLYWLRKHRGKDGHRKQRDYVPAKANVL